MWQTLLFSLNCVAPFFLLIVLGAVFRKTGIAPRSFFEAANRFTYRIALPFNLFCNILEIDRNGTAAGGYLVYVFLVTVFSFAVIWLVTELLFGDKSLVGTLVQGGFRGNFVLLGVPLAGAVMGPSAQRTAALASAVVIPLYNALSVVVLLVRGKNREKQTVRSVLTGILKNPLIIAICLAIPLMCLGVRLPAMLAQTATYIGQTATPLGLISIGGLLNLSDATARLRPALYASAIKNLLLPVSVMTISFFLGFRGEALLTLLVLSAAPVAVSSYVMAEEMGGDGALASNILIITTFVSAFVLAAGIYLLKFFALI